jgi:hypothetical protein
MSQEENKAVENFRRNPRCSECVKERVPGRAFTYRRYAAESALIEFHVLSQKVVLTQSVKPCC